LIDIMKKILLGLFINFLIVPSLFAANIPIDYMEYATDAAAQAAYINNGGIDDSYTKLLLHCDGTDGSQTFTDESGKTVTANGNAQIDTAQKEFGTGSGLFDGTGDYLSLVDSTDWDFGTDFTIDCWVSSTNPLLGNYQCLLGQYVDDNNFAGVMHLDNNDSIGFMIQTGGVWRQVYLEPYTFSADTWYHIAIVSSSNSIKTYVNGTQVGSARTGYQTTFASPLYINGRYQATASYLFSGHLDEIRISKGIARWTSNFTPPTSAYAPLQCYSESTIKTQGSYSLKVIANATSSLNKTLTRTVSPTINLSDQTLSKFNIQATRTGSNIKIGLHDSGGTTTEVTPNIISSSTWQTVTVDLSGVSNANKDAIDQIIITNTNADSDNTGYIDDLFCSTVNDVFGIVE